MKPANEITFLNLYESIEGKIEISKCPMDKKVCPFDKCIMDNISNRMMFEFREYLSKQNLAGYLG